MTPSPEKRSPAGGPGSEGAITCGGLRGDHTPPAANVLDFEAAELRREAGMASCLRHADDEVLNWSVEAFRLLREFAAGEPGTWTAERFRSWAHGHGLPLPPESRAFGPIIQRGLRAGLFVRVGYAPAASSNGSPKPTYARPALQVAA